jgi:hypothetical protein
VWHDAKYLADHIATQRQYLEYRVAAPARAPVSCQRLIIFPGVF